MTMREKIARAFYEQRSRFTIQPNRRTYDELDDVQRAQLLASADAVLDAIREPTESMVAAAAETPGMKAVSSAMELHQARGYGFEPGSFDDGSPLHQAWRAMIDAAKAGR